MDNENQDSWKWFLQNMKDHLPILFQDHPNEGIEYKYFTFISDRQKGLVNALTEVFPQNHSCYYAVHIQRNLERLNRKKWQNM